MTSKEKKYFDGLRAEIQHTKKTIENKALSFYSHSDFTRQITENVIFTLFSVEYAIEGYKTMFDQIEGVLE